MYTAVDISEKITMFSEEVQQWILIIFGIGSAIVTLSKIIQPFLDRAREKREAIQSVQNTEALKNELSSLVDGATKGTNKVLLDGELLTWQQRLNLAQTETEKDAIRMHIAKIEAQINA